MALLRTLTILLLTAAFSLPAQAAEPSLNDQLNLLISQGRFQEAYLLATDNLFDHEGEPEFDFLYGLSALETGNADEAVFAFERIAYTYPNQRRVKLELARAYFMSNNLGAAEDLFNEVLDTNPEPNVQANIEAFLDAIESRQRNQTSSLTWFVNSSLGSDSNINSATELGVIDTPIGDVELGPGGQSIDDNFMDLGGGFTYNYPLDKTQALVLSGNANQHNNLDTDRFDITTMSVEGAYVLTRDNHRFTSSLRMQKVNLDNEGFQKSSSLLGTWQRNGSEGWSQAVTGALTAVRFDNNSSSPNNELRDVNQVLVSGNLGKVTGDFVHNLSVYIGDEYSLRDIGKNNAQTFYGVAFSQQYQFRPGHLPFFRVSMHRSENKRNDPVFAIEREDQTFSATFGWRWQFNRQLNINTDLTWTENDSNIDLYEYDRLRFQTGLRYQF